MNRLLYTTGKGYFEECSYDYPVSKKAHIIVKNIMTGVCRSDLDMMQGKFGPLPLCMQGHEGLGKVIDVGDDLFTTVKIGDIVATRGEPAYADQYSVKNNEFVVVPKADPCYIIEPVACGINIILAYIEEISNHVLFGKKILLMGSGFLSYIAYNTLKLWGSEFNTAEIDVVGSSNQDMWEEMGVTLLKDTGDYYDIVIDINGNVPLFLNQNIINDNALLIEAVSRDISKKENDLLQWKSVTTVRPSPRNAGFHGCMELAVDWIKNGKLTVDKFWTRGYSRDSEWQQAFSDGIKRPANYSRGYIIWP